MVSELHFHGDIVGRLAKGIVMANIVNSLNMWNGAHKLHDCNNAGVQ